MRLLRNCNKIGCACVRLAAFRRIYAFSRGRPGPLTRLDLRQCLRRQVWARCRSSFLPAAPHRWSFCPASDAWATTTPRPHAHAHGPHAHAHTHTHTHMGLLSRVLSWPARTRDRPSPRPIGVVGAPARSRSRCPGRRGVGLSRGGPRVGHVGKDGRPETLSPELGPSSRGAPRRFAGFLRGNDRVEEGRHGWYKLGYANPSRSGPSLFLGSASFGVNYSGGPPFSADAACRAATKKVGSVVGSLAAVR